MARLTQKNRNNPPVLEYDISGIGVIKATQESVKTKTNICFVHDRDQIGNLVRVGYFLISRDNNKQVSPIKWFCKDDINISLQKSYGGIPGTGRLAVSFKHPKKNEKHFSVLLPISGIKVRLRCIFRIEKNGVKNFIIMLDTNILREGKYSWKGIARYDCAHGFLHKDVFNASGKRVLKKEKLPTQNKLEAIKFITNELLNDLKMLGILLSDAKIFKEKLKISPTQALVEIRKTEEVMTQLLKTPKAFQQLESTTIDFTEINSSKESFFS